MSNFNKNSNTEFLMNPGINVSQNHDPSLVVQEQQHQLLSDDDLPKISLSRAKADEEPALQPFTTNDRNLFIYLTAMQIFQAVLNMISSIVFWAEREYCDVNIRNYQIMLVLGSIFAIITLFVITCVKVFRKHTYAILSLILYFLCEAYLLGVVTCYFETLYVQFVSIFMIVDLLGMVFYFAVGIKERVSLIRATPFIIVSNILGFIVSYFSTEIDNYEAFGTLLAGFNFCCFYVWLLKMIHLKKIHGKVSLFRLKFIAPVVIQIDLVFLTFFSIFFIGV